MDSSQYLRRLKEKCPNVISRNQCVDASQRTAMVGLAATRTFNSYNTKSTNIPLSCNTSSSAFGNGGGNSDVTPVKLPEGCPSQGICNYFTDRYTTPTITLPGYTYPDISSSYTPVCTYTPYYGTTSQQSQAVKNVVDRDVHKCCTN